MFKYDYVYSQNQNVIPEYIGFLKDEVAAAFGEPPFFKLSAHPYIDKFSFIFLEALDESGLARLTSLVTGFTLLNYKVKVGRYSQLDDPYAAPIDQDFSVALNRKLYKKNTSIWQGDILQTTYYAECDSNGKLSDPVIHWDTAVTYNANATIQVVDTIYWITEKGSYHPTKKVLSELYAGQRWLDWLAGKREQIISWMRYWVAVSMMASGIPQKETMADGAAFFGFYSDKIVAYVNGYDLDLDHLITADATYSWLDKDWFDGSMTIRAKFHEQLVYS